MNAANKARSCLAVIVLSLIPFTARADSTKVSAKYQKWLEEDVACIITSVERDVFFKLQTDRERDSFIEAFWKHRDPTPGTPENEFKTEHYRRLAYANQYLGRDAVGPGSRTDRGRMYILLGEPQDIERFNGIGIYQAEAWFYQGKTDLGLPAGFYLLFFKRRGQGVLKLYSPFADGPQALITGYDGDPTNYSKALSALKKIEPELATVSMSLVPGEESSVSGQPSMASDLLIQNIDAVPSRIVQSQYARKFLEYKDLVDVEYTANYIDNSSLIKVFKEPATGMHFVHYAVEPQKLSLAQYEDKVYATLRVSGRITTLDGRLVYQYDKSVPFEMPSSRLAEISHALCDYCDVFPLVGGDYRLSILIKNDVSKEFTTVESILRVPPKTAAVELSQPVLGYKVVRGVDAQKKIRAFQVGPYLVSCQPGRLFAANDTLAVAFQVNDVPPAMAGDCRIRVAFFNNGQLFREILRRPSDYPDFPDIVETVGLADFPPAHYQVRVSILLGGAEAVSAEEEFDRTFAANAPRPWYISRVLPEANAPTYALIVGAQLYNLGRYEEARLSCERAFEKMPGSTEAAIHLARADMALEEYRKAVQVLAPFLEPPKDVPYDMRILAAEAYGKSGDLAGAVGVLNDAIARYGVNASLMNALGETYAALGKSAEALAAFRKSLELSPDQPEIRKKAEALGMRE